MDETRHRFCGAAMSLPEERCYGCKIARERAVADAAPWLLAACKEVVAAWEDSTHVDDLAAAMKRAMPVVRAAVAKAGGA